MKRERDEAVPQAIFVGDVQGCGDEFDLLLERAAEAFGDDFQLHVVGDLINRGPHNLRLLEQLREMVEAGRARYVLGNHEISLLRVAFELRDLTARDSFGDVLESSECDDWVEWLRGVPLVDCGEVAGDRYAMVHAAVHPKWSRSELARRARSLERRLASGDVSDAIELLDPEASDTRVQAEQDVLGRLTRCRSVWGDEWSSEISDDPREAWHVAWAKEGHDYGIVYGHWALQGLHVARGLRGLDTGLVHHGRGRDGYLTAWLPDASSARENRWLFDLPDDRLWQVRALRRYYEY